MLLDGPQEVTIVAESVSYSAGSAVITVLDNEAWLNPENPYDVNGDGVVSPRDVLFVINELNAPRYRDPQGHLLTPYVIGAPHFDVNGDGFCSPRDVLLIINRLNTQGGAQGEGEASESATVASLPASSHSGLTPRSARALEIRDAGFAAAAAERWRDGWLEAQQSFVPLVEDAQGLGSRAAETRGWQTTSRAAYHDRALVDLEETTLLDDTLNDLLEEISPLRKERNPS